MNKIKIVKNGLYIVTGNIPLEELIIRKGKDDNYYEKGKTFEQNETYALCRCGYSKNKPFCDAEHIRNNYND